MARAGLPAAFRYHDLHHHFASALIAGGCSVKVVQKALGHARARETLDTYGHLWPDSEDLTRRAVELALGAAAAEAEPTTETGRAKSGRKGWSSSGRVHDERGSKALYELLESVADEYDMVGDAIDRLPTPKLMQWAYELSVVATGTGVYPVGRLRD